MKLLLYILLSLYRLDTGGYKYIYINKSTITSFINGSRVVKNGQEDVQRRQADASSVGFRSAEL